MDHIGERLIWYYVPFTDIPMPGGGLNVVTVLSSIVTMVTLWAVFWMGARKRADIPGRGQLVVEMIVGGFDGLVASSLEFEKREDNRKFLPLITSLFLFLVLSNYIGFLPLPHIEEPTADINTTLSLGLMAMGLATYCAMRAKGVVGYLEELCGPMWAQPGIAGKLSAVFFFPLNVIGELSKIVSISFRLFGNIIGGSIIIVVVSQLTYHLVVPIGLNLFFVFFVGVIQAFVFTMLTLTYIAVAIK